MVTDPKEFPTGSERYHRKLVDSFVMPWMLALTLLFYVTYWPSDYFSMAWMIVFGPLAVAFNVFIAMRNRRFHLFGRTFDTRSHEIDALRWMITMFVVNPAMLIYFHPRPAVMLAIWASVILASHADTFMRPHRRLVVMSGLGSGLLTIGYVHNDMPVLELIMLMLCLLGVTAMAEVTERYWLSEVRARELLQERDIHSQSVIKRMARDAAMGAHGRVISHELNNLISIIDIATAMPDRMDHARIRKSIEYIKRINGLVLHDIDAHTDLRDCSVGSLFEDINVVMKKSVWSDGIDFYAEVSSDVAGLIFTERSGSAFLIINNIVKNAREAIQSQLQRTGGGRIDVHAYRDGDAIVFSIRDNGPGMSDQIQKSILSGSMGSTKAEGHGIGLKFVYDECRKNQFGLKIESAEGEGARFLLRVPLSVVTSRQH